MKEKFLILTEYNFPFTPLVESLKLLYHHGYKNIITRGSRAGEINLPTLNHTSNIYCLEWDYLVYLDNFIWLTSTNTFDSLTNLMLEKEHGRVLPCQDTHPYRIHSRASYHSSLYFSPIPLSKGDIWRQGDLLWFEGVRDMYRSVRNERDILPTYTNRLRLAFIETETPHLSEEFIEKLKIAEEKVGGQQLVHEAMLTFLSGLYSD